MLQINVEYAPRIKLMGFVSYQAPWLHFRRTTDEYILYFIKSGELHIREGETRYALTRGDVLLLEPDVEHEGLEKHPCDYFYIHFEHRDIRPQPVAETDKLALAKRVLLEDKEDPAMPAVCCFPKHYSFPDRSSLQRALREMQDMTALHRKKSYNRALAALKLLEWMIGVSRDDLTAALQRGDSRPARAYAKVNALLDYIHERYTERITGELIEREFECNYDYLNRIFQETTGRTISRYVNYVRIERAKELIEATHLSMNEIGYLTGLGDPFYFSKVFKRYVGLSPTQYDKKLREGMGR